MTFFFDTCWLRRAYVPGPLRRRCRALLSRNAGNVYVAEITMLEIVSALCSELNGNRITRAEYETGQRDFLSDVASGRILVRPFGQQEYLASRAFLHHAGFNMSRHLKTQDAIVACTARELALARREGVRFYTCDHRFASTLKAMEAFKLLAVTHIPV